MIVSLTTIPSKFDHLYLTIDSLINQTILPTKIIINIPKKYNFRMHGEIPEHKIAEFESKYSNCIINKVDTDYGPGTKLLGLLNSELINTIDKTSYIILVDDDLIYKPCMIETFMNNVDVGSCWVYNYNNIKIGQGADGFIIKLNQLDTFLDYYNLIKDQDYIHYHDDFYISYYFHLINKPVQYIKPPNNCLIYSEHPNTYTDALCNLSGKYSRHNLNENIYNLLTLLCVNGHFDSLKKKFKYYP